MEPTNLKVWSWSGRDSASGEDLLFVIAVGSRTSLQQVSVRLSLPSPKKATRVLPSDSAHAEAIADHGRLLWLDLGDLPLGRSHTPLHWSREEELHAMRAAKRR